MTEKYRAMIRRHSDPLQPIATLETPILRPLGGLRGVMFDIYGTLLISGCGEIGTNQAIAEGQKFVAALAEAGIQVIDGDSGVRWLQQEIKAEHQLARESGVSYPEVDIVEIWQRVIRKLVAAGHANVSNHQLSELDYQQIALAYELRVNPVWPMPHATECLGNLSRLGMQLGVISNAQLLTIEICQTLLQSNSNVFFSENELQFYSFQHKRAKPGVELYELAAKRLSRRGLETNQILYVGNDMLNDIWPAQTLGFRTALFAGDARSVRHRKDDPRVAQVTPDVVLTDLLHIEDCIR